MKYTLYTGSGILSEARTLKSTLSAPATTSHRYSGLLGGHRKRIGGLVRPSLLAQHLSQISERSRVLDLAFSWQAFSKQLKSVHLKFAQEKEPRNKIMSKGEVASLDQRQILNFWFLISLASRNQARLLASYSRTFIMFFKLL